MTLLKDLKIGDIVLVEEHKVPAKFILVNKHVEYTTECGNIEYGSILLRVDLATVQVVPGYIHRGYLLLLVSENGTYIDDSEILHGKEKDD